MVKKFWPAALKSTISRLALGPEHPQILPNLQYSDQHLAIFGLSNPDWPLGELQGACTCCLGKDILIHSSHQRWMIFMVLDVQLGIIPSRSVECSLLGDFSTVQNYHTRCGHLLKYSNSTQLPLPLSIIFKWLFILFPSHNTAYCIIHLSIFRIQLVVEQEDGKTGMWVWRS